MKSRRIKKWIITTIHVTIFVIVLIIILSIAAFSIYLRSDSYSTRLTYEALKYLRSTLEREVELESITFSFLPFGVLIEDLVIYGPNGTKEIPFCQVERVRLGVDIMKLFRKQLVVSSIQLENASINIIYYKEGGHNFISIKKKEGPSTKSPFDFTVKKVVVSSMKILFKHEDIPLIFYTKNLNSVFLYDRQAKGFRSHLTFTHGMLKIKDFNEWKFNSEMEFIARGSGLEFDYMVFVSKGIKMVNHGTMVDFRKRIFDLEVFLAYDCKEVKYWFLVPTALEGQGYFTGTYKGTFSRFNVDGNFYIDDFRIYNFRYATMAGKFWMNDDELTIERMYGSLADGKFEGFFNIKPLHGRSYYRSWANFWDARLEYFGKWFNLLPLLPDGNSAFKGNLRWYEDSFKNFKGSFDLVFNNDETVEMNYYENISSYDQPVVFPANGFIKGNLENYAITELEASVATAHSHYTFSGRADFRGNLALDVVADTKKIRETDFLYHLIESKVTDKELQIDDLWEIKGRTFFKGKVKESLSNIKFEGAFSSKDITFRKVFWGDCTGKVIFSNRIFNVRDIVVTKGEGQFIADHAIFNLGNNGFFEDGDVSAKVNFRKYGVQDVIKSINWDIPMDGNLLGNVDISGTTSDIKIMADLNIFNAVLYDNAVDSMNLVLRYGSREIVIENASLRAKKALVNGNMEINLENNTFRNVAVIVNEFPLQSLADVLKIKMAGKVTGDIKVSGSIFKPEGKMKAHVKDFNIAGFGIGNFDCEAKAGKEGITVNLLTKELFERLPVVSLDAVANYAPPYAFTVDAQFNRFPISLPLSSISAGSSVIEGNLSMNIKSSGTFEKYRNDNITLGISNLSYHLQDFQIRNSEPFVLLVSSKEVRLPETQFSLDESRFVMKGIVDLNRGELSSLLVKGDVDLKIAENFFTGLYSRGIGNVALEATNHEGNIIYEGKMLITNGTLKYKNFPLILSALSGAVNFSKQEITFSNVSAQSGGGDIFIDGVFKFKESQFSTFSISSRGRNIAFQYPVDMISYGDFDIDWFGTTESSIISGDVKTDQASWNKDMSISSFLKESAVNAVETGESDWLDNIKLNLHILAPREITFQAKFGNLEVIMDEKVDLYVVNSINEPVLLGRATTNYGTILFLGNEFKVTKGIIDFINPNETIAQLSLIAETYISEYLVKLMINGTIDKLLFQFSSEPPLAQTDIWGLISGQKIEPGEFSSSRAYAEDSTIAAIGSSYLTSPILGAIQEETKKILGLNKLEISPTNLSTETNPSARITINKYLTRDITITYSADLTSSNEQIVLIEFQIAPGIVAVASRNEEGYYGLDFRLNKTF